MSQLPHSAACRRTCGTHHNRNKYKHIHYSQNFDFLPQKVDSATPALFYELSFRLVRFRLPNGTYETVITNLDPESFPSIKLKQLYALRWGIENSFRQLKHTVGLLHFHAKKAEFIQQEVFARLLMYNFTELITALAAIHRDDKRYTSLNCCVLYALVKGRYHIKMFVLAIVYFQSGENSFHKKLLHAI